MGQAAIDALGTGYVIGSPSGIRARLFHGSGKCDRFFYSFSDNKKALFCIMASSSSDSSIAPNPVTLSCTLLSHPHVLNIQPQK